MSRTVPGYPYLFRGDYYLVLSEGVSVADAKIKYHMLCKVKPYKVKPLNNGPSIRRNSPYN